MKELVDQTRERICLVTLWSRSMGTPRFLAKMPSQRFSLVLVPGSYIQSAEKSFSLVRGGRAQEAAALAWERKGPTPDRESYKNWASSIMDNPALIETKVESNAVQE